MALSNLTGFNPSVVQTSINGVKTAYNNLIEQIGTRMQNEFINGMAEMWACDEAVDFFTNVVKDNIDRLIPAVNTTFETIVGTMDNQARMWAENTGNASVYVSTQFEQNPKTSVDVSCIQNATATGERGIDVENYGTVVNKLPDIYEQAKSAAQAAQQAVSDCGFLGGDQPTTLYNSLEKVKNSIDSAISTITQLLQTNINNTVSRYGALQTQTSSRFQVEE